MKRISSEMTRTGMQGPWALVLAGVTFVSQPFHRVGQTTMFGLNNFHRRSFPGPIDPGPILQVPSEISGRLR